MKTTLVSYKKCPKCGAQKTSENSIYTGKCIYFIYFNCADENCKSTFVMKRRTYSLFTKKVV